MSNTHGQWLERIRGKKYGEEKSVRLIDADALRLSMMLIAPGETKKYCYPCKEILKEIDDAPTIEERKKGIWIKTGQSFVFPEKFRNYSCSECGYDVDKTKFNFCPNCGADMRGE